MPRRSAPYERGRATIAELAAGAVLRFRGTREILLLHEPSEDRWCLAKGHVEAGESLEETALREVVEETGIGDLDLGPELCEVHYRFFRPEDGRNVLKTVVYFIAETSQRGVTPERTFDAAEWVDADRARERVRFAADREVLEHFRRRG